MSVNFSSIRKVFFRLKTTPLTVDFLGKLPSKNIACTSKENFQKDKLLALAARHKTNHNIKHLLMHSKQ